MIRFDPSGLRRYLVIMETTNIAIKADSMDIDRSEYGPFICFYIGGVLIAIIFDKGVQEVMCNGETVYRTERRGMHGQQDAIG